LNPVAAYIAALRASPRYGRQVAHHRVLPERMLTPGATRRPWSRAVDGVLAAKGISGLYSHQALAMDAARSGRHVIAATPTASGKSLIYNLPILERCVIDPDARALMLFPLKALARDQLAAFELLTAHWPEAARPTALIYDGDTPDAARRKIRKNPPNVVISNPEMLHLALLPHHEQWTTLFASLAYVVVDEAHTYRGVLGAHMAQIFRRLMRICARYGARPVFVLCSATVGNPGEVAERLIGADKNGMGEAVVITESGAPAGARHMVFVDPEDSPATTAIALLQAALARNLRTIVYCRSRRMT
jgi:DEAD/DEAH box helicase domain-containing protein